MKPATEFRDIYRVQNALKALERYNDPDLNTYIKPILLHRLGENPDLPESKKTVIAFSGGIDSKATLLIAKEFHLNPDAVTFLTSDPENIEKFCERNDIKVYFIYDEKYENVLKEAENKRFHPCGRCQKFITQKIYSFAREKKYKFIGFGDMLSVGSHSIMKIGDMYRLNIPAMLSLNKNDHIEITGEYPDRFGCEFLKNIHRKYPFLRRYSIQRVLRELRSQSIDVETAKKLIESIEESTCL
ncbi:MAG: hypothetical protein J7J21_02110 [Methanomicrobia archaeon]|nr:hypothetical protein [Methanomicrobia archaeon]